MKGLSLQITQLCSYPREGGSQTFLLSSFLSATMISASGNLSSELPFSEGKLSFFKKNQLSSLLPFPLSQSFSLILCGASCGTEDNFLKVNIRRVVFN